MISRVAELQDRVVFPGERLASIEEFIPGEGCYADNAYIYSAIFGRVQVNINLRRISVKPFQPKPRIPQKNSQIYGHVASIIREDLALVKILFDDRGKMFSGSFTGILHLSQASPQKVDSIYDVVRIGDVIKATILSTNNPYILSIKQATNGVIMAFCSKCGSPLYRIPGEEGLVCLKCGNREKRKISSHYMLVVKRERKTTMA